MALKGAGPGPIPFRPSETHQTFLPGFLTSRLPPAFFLVYLCWKRLLLLSHREGRSPPHPPPPPPPGPVGKGRCCNNPAWDRPGVATGAPGHLHSLPVLGPSNRPSLRREAVLGPRKPLRTAFPGGCPASFRLCLSAPLPLPLRSSSAALGLLILCPGLGCPCISSPASPAVPAVGPQRPARAPSLGCTPPPLPSWLSGALPRSRLASSP